MMLENILTPVAAMATLGLLFGAALAFALKIFAVKVDPNMLKILSLLPGVNCGACGSAGCAAFADALAKGETVPAACTVSDDQSRKEIAKLLGLEDQTKVKMVATLLCNGGTRAKDKYVYSGITTCKAATLLFQGQKACTFGCLGFGECIEACPFGALSMGEDGLPVVDEAKCTACGKCLRACPKNLYVLMPVTIRYYVKCSSKDAGGLTMKTCSSGCIGCMKCQKACPSGAVKVESNLARIDPEKCQNIGKCVEVCPTKVIVRRG